MAVGSLSQVARIASGAADELRTLTSRGASARIERLSDDLFWAGEQLTEAGLTSNAARAHLLPHLSQRGYDLAGQIDDLALELGRGASIDQIRTGAQQIAATVDRFAAQIARFG